MDKKSPGLNQKQIEKLEALKEVQKSMPRQVQNKINPEEIAEQERKIEYLYKNIDFLDILIQLSDEKRKKLLDAQQSKLPKSEIITDDDDESSEDEVPEGLTAEKFKFLKENGVKLPKGYVHKPSKVSSDNTTRTVLSKLPDEVISFLDELDLPPDDLGDNGWPCPTDEERKFFENRRKLRDSQRMSELRKQLLMRHHDQLGDKDKYDWDKITHPQITMEELEAILHDDIENEIESSVPLTDKEIDYINSVTKSSSSSSSSGETKSDSSMAEIVNPNDPGEVKIRKDTANSFKEQGNKAFNDGSFQQAEDLYTSALAFESNDPKFWTNRAQARLKLGNYQGCIQDCEYAALSDESWPKSYYLRARAEKLAGNFTEAYKSVACLQQYEPYLAKKMLEEIEEAHVKEIPTIKNHNR